MAEKKKVKKPVLGFFSFSCDQGCQFTVLFIENLFNLLNQFDVQYFHLLKEKNRKAKFDLAFIEGAVTTKDQIRKLKEIRAKSKFVVAMGACACHGGIPAMRNFIENKELQKYVYNQRMLKGAVKAAGIGEYIKVDYWMRGCPIIKEEFINFIQNFAKGKIIEEPKGPVCSECPRQGTPNCFLRQKKECLGPVTHSGCGALCPKGNFPCMLCRGPLEKANLAGEITLFKNWGLDEKKIVQRLNMFKNIET